MTPSRFTAVTLCWAVAALLLSAGTGAQSAQIPLYGAAPFTARSIPAHLNGQLTVAFHGDTASGCARRGLCGYAGTVSWRPPPDGQVQLLGYRDHGHVSYALDLVLQGSSENQLQVGGVATSSVEQTSPGAASDCVDTTATGGVLVLPLAHGRVTFTLAGPGPSILDTRCAGPLASDVQPALPTPTLPLQRILRGGTTLDLGALRAFASHGLAGAVDSTLSISLGRAGPAGAPATDIFQGPGPKERYREVKATYRASLTGTVREHVGGDSDPQACALLGSCGAVGTVILLPRVSGAEAELTATAPARAPYRDLLRALGASGRGRADGITAMGGVTWPSGGTVRTDLRQGAATCADSAPLGTGAIQLEASNGRLAAGYAPSGASTRCPGPLVGGAAPFLAAGEIPLPARARRTIRLELTRGRSFTDYGYMARATPHLVLTLTRIRITSRVVVALAGSL